jgi:phosphocarrier protein HPr
VTESVEERVFTITNKLGLHARAANMVVQSASHFTSRITITKDGIEANAKSIMGLLLLAAAQGSRVKVRAVGVDARQAIAAIGRLIKEQFGEQEHTARKR